MSQADIASRVAESLKLVDLAGTEHARCPPSCPAGMRKRVGLARAIALRPKYLLYDEPTTGLDPVTAAVIDRLIVRTREAHRGDQSRDHPRHAVGVHGRGPDRDAVQGRIRQVGTVDEIRTDDRSRGAAVSSRAGRTHGPPSGRAS